MEFRSALKNRFTLDRLRGRAGARGAAMDLGLGMGDQQLMTADESFDFVSMNPRSFLPSFVDLSRENDLNLVLVRLRRRPTDEGNRPEEDPRLEGYLEDLRAWLNQESIPYFDFSDETDLTIDWYGEGDHIATTHTTRYTEMLYQRLRTVFEDDR